MRLLLLLLATSASAGVLPVEDLSKEGTVQALQYGRSLRPTQVDVLQRRCVTMTLTEGRFHQVKRMLGAVGLPVLSLHREAIGGLELDVEEGAFRLLGEDEVSGKLR